MSAKNEKYLLLGDYTITIREDRHGVKSTHLGKIGDYFEMRVKNNELQVRIPHSEINWVGVSMNHFALMLKELGVDQQMIALLDTK